MLAALVVAASIGQGDGAKIPLARTPSRHYAVDVRIDGDGPHAFLIDTGASHSAIAEPLAVRFGFEPADRRDPVQSLTTRYEAERFVVPGVEIGGFEAGAVDMIVARIAPDDTLAAWGLIGADVFGARTVRIDLAAGELELGAPAPVHADARVDPATDLVFATARVGRFDIPVHVLVDTGAPRTLVNPALARRLADMDPVLRLSVSDMADLVRVEETRLVQLATVRVGGMCTRNVVGVEADLDIFRALDWLREPAMVLGLDVLEDGAITIDRTTGMVALDAERPCPEPRVQRGQARSPLPDR